MKKTPKYQLVVLKVSNGVEMALTHFKNRIIYTAQTSHT
jgi:hypothetical protein